jgi:hypothetical protein
MRLPAISTVHNSTFLIGDATIVASTVSRKHLTH